MSDTSPTSDYTSSDPSSSATVARSPFGFRDVDGPGSQIGPYKILHLLGEGGFGLVYLAEQREPVSRRVALKVIKLGMDSREVLARFEQERQALAMMDHPHVARFFDAGVTTNGRPFFAMEYVSGVPLTKYCDSARLNTRERLKLFVSVCLAVQHAHQKGIIHRDLKPGNILVTLVDGKPMPKVIDFGIAKAMSQRLTQKTLFTEHGRMIGTPEYMSPEQAGTTGLDIDTRADIYSLGVVLYELLVGMLPFDPRTLREAAYDEVVRIIREQDPPRLSTRLSGLGQALTTTAQNRREAPSDLRRQLSGDLDWITMHAIEKDRARRYATVKDLADDVERFLASEPVKARPPTAMYRLSKFIKRHRFGVTSAAVVAAALLLGLAGTTVALSRAVKAESAARIAAESERFARDNAELARAAAESERDRAETVSSFLTDLFAEANPASGNRRDMPIREALDAGARQADASFIQRPDLGSAVRLSMARSYIGLGMYEEADRLVSNVVGERTARLGPDHADVGEAHHVRGMLLTSWGRHDDAIAALRTAQNIRSAALGARSEQVGWTLFTLSRPLLAKKQPAEAEKAATEARDIFVELFGPADRRTARANANLAAALGADPKRIDDAIAALNAAATGLRTGGQTLELSNVLNNLGDRLRFASKFTEARPVLEEALMIRQRLLPPDHPQLAQSLSNLALVAQAMGDLSGAESSLRDAVTISRRGGKDPSSLLDTHLLNLANVLNDQGKAADAEPLAREADELRRAKHPSNHPERAYTALLLGRILAETERAKEAEPLLRESLAIFTSNMRPDDWRIAQASSALGGCLFSLGRNDEARPLLESSYPRLRDSLSETHLRTRQAAARLATMYAAMNDDAKAEEFTRLSREQK